MSRPLKSSTSDPGSAERYVFAANAKGGSMSGDQMNKTISIALGFEKHVTTHAFRWMVARAVFTKRGCDMMPGLTIR